MNFFAHQAKARSNTTKLVVLFSLAVISLIALTQVFIIIAYAWSQGISVSDLNTLFFAIEQLGHKNFVLVALSIIVIIITAWLYKAAQLSGGGKVVAEALNGTRILPNTQDIDELKALNIVEEMAIASGIPVPPIYLIEENGINAFAAGYSSRDAVIGITRGCIHALNREELQGVIAHEFSHIFNGDMRLNIKLISVLHGILVIGLIGRFILRAGSNGRRNSSRDSKGAPPIILLGFGLMAIGYLGTFFGGLIKAAVSRQREFLADASAVQFTRNPQSISNALKKIGGYPLGSFIHHPEADEISHLFFNQAISLKFSGLMATHPPLTERIKRIEPRWRGDFIKVTLPEDAKINPYYLRPSRQGIKIDPDAYKKVAPPEKLNPIEYLGALSNTIAPSIGTTVMEYSGAPINSHMTEAKNILDEMPEMLKKCAHDTYDAQALMYCLLLDKHRANIYENQLAYLQKKLPADISREVFRIKDHVAILALRYRLPLVDIAIGTLKLLSKEQYLTFKLHLISIIKADKIIDLTEWSLYRMVTHHIEDKASAKIGRKSFNQLQKDCQRLLSAISIASSENLIDAKTAFNKGWEGLSLPTTFLIEDCLSNTNLLEKSLQGCNNLHPLKKPQLIKACCNCLYNSKDPEGIELIRVIADGLDVPMPPSINNQTLC